MLMADIETFKTVLKPDDLEAIGESDIKNGDLSLRDLETLQDSPDDPTMRKSFKQRLESFRTDRELKLRLHDVNTLEERYLYSYLAALRFLSDYQSRRKQYVVASKRMKADYSKIAGVPEAIPVLEKALKDCSADRATKAYADLLAAFRRELSSEEGSASMSIHERLGWDRDLVRLLVKVEGFVQKANHCLITAEDLNVSEIGLAQKVKLLDKIVDLRPDEWRYRHALYIDREIRIRIKDITQSKTPGREVDIGPLKAEIIKLKDEQALVVDAERERDQQKRIQKAIDQQFLPTDLNASVTLRDRLPALGDYAHARARLVDLQKIVANRITQLRPKKPAPRPGKTETIVPEYFLCDEKTEQLCQQEALKKMEDLRLEIEGLASRAEALDSQLSDTKGELAKIDPATTSASEKKKRSDLIEKQKKLEERLQKARKKLLELEAQKNPKYVIIIRRGYQ
ncbi:MAG: hypothetical protein NXI24_02100 [bacterium]|nr:hypothetical protein [bacterium]